MDPRRRGTKVGAHYILHLQPGEEVHVNLRFYPQDNAPDETFGEAFNTIMAQRLAEAD